MVKNPYECLVKLEEAYKKWSDLRASMVGTLYPNIVDSKYLAPLRYKINMLKYHDQFKHINFSRVWDIVRRQA